MKEVNNMSIYEAVELMRRGMNNCAYELGSTSYQDRCEGISVSSRGDTLIVVVRMHVADPYYKQEVINNVDSTIDSIRYQYHIPYGVEYEIRWC